MADLGCTLLAGFVILWAWVISAAIPRCPAKRRPMPPWLVSAGTAPIPEPGKLIGEPGRGITPRRDT
jgi:hypothetical protein